MTTTGGRVSMRWAVEFVTREDILADGEGSDGKEEKNRDTLIYTPAGG